MMETIRGFCATCQKQTHATGNPLRCIRCGADPYAKPVKK